MSSVRNTEDEQAQREVLSTVPAESAPVQVRASLTVSSLIVAATGWLFGFDTGSIGPVTETATFFKINPGVQGTIVATILISAFVMSFAGGPLADRYSRRLIISSGCGIFAFGSILCAAAQSLGMFVAGRTIAGLGEGLFLSVAGTWLVEVAPQQKRGKIAALQQLFVAFGLAGGYFVTYGALSAPGTWQWRVPFACQSAVAAMIAAATVTPLAPESPRWLILRPSKATSAYAVVDAFSSDARTAELERAYLQQWAAQEQQARDAHAARQPTLSERLGLASISTCWQKVEQRRWKTLAGIVLLGVQQLSGIDAVLFYAPIIFTSAGLSSQQGSFLASGVSGIVGAVVTVPAQLWMVERVGRRSTTIVGGVVLGVCMYLIGLLFATKAADTSEAARRCIIALIYEKIFVATYCATWSIVLRIYVSEIQPSRTRASANGLSQASNWLVNIAIALSTPSFLEKSRPAVYILFGSFCFIGALLGVLMFETKGLSSADIDEAWDKRDRQLRLAWRRSRFLKSRQDAAPPSVMGLDNIPRASE